MRAMAFGQQAAGADMQEEAAEQRQQDRQHARVGQRSVELGRLRRRAGDVVYASRREIRKLSAQLDKLRELSLKDAA